MDKPSLSLRVAFLSARAPGRFPSGSGRARKLRTAALATRTCQSRVTCRAARRLPSTSGRPPGRRLAPAALAGAGAAGRRTADSAAPPCRLIWCSRMRPPSHVRASCQPIPACRATARSRGPSDAVAPRSARSRLRVRLRRLASAPRAERLASPRGTVIRRRRRLRGSWRLAAPQDAEVPGAVTGTHPDRAGPASRAARKERRDYRGPGLAGGLARVRRPDLPLLAAGGQSTAQQPGAGQAGHGGQVLPVPPLDRSPVCSICATAVAARGDLPGPVLTAVTSRRPGRSSVPPPSARPVPRPARRAGRRRRRGRSRFQVPRPLAALVTAAPRAVPGCPP